MAPKIVRVNVVARSAPPAPPPAPEWPDLPIEDRWFGQRWCRKRGRWLKPVPYQALKVGDVVRIVDHVGNVIGPNGKKAGLYFAVWRVTQLATPNTERGAGWCMNRLLNLVVYRSERMH